MFLEDSCNSPTTIVCTNIGSPHTPNALLGCGEERGAEEEEEEEAERRSEEFVTVAGAAVDEEADEEEEAEEEEGMVVGGEESEAEEVAEGAAGEIGVEEGSRGAVDVRVESSSTNTRNNPNS